MWWNNMNEEYNEVLPYDIMECEECDGIQSPIKPTNCSERWATIAYMKGMKQKNDDVYATTIAYYISFVMTGMGVSASSEYVYFKESLGDEIFIALNHVKNLPISEQKQKRTLWDMIFDIFYGGMRMAQQHEKTYAVATIPTPRSTKEELLRHGDSIHSAVVNLMKNMDITQEKQVHVPVEDIVRISLQLTWSEQKQWDKIPCKNHTQKLYWLLAGGEKKC